MDGILLINKPKGWTSHDVVAKARNILRASSQESVNSNQSKQNTDNRLLNTPLPKVKVGHTGTLDPMATGLLVLVVGNYTKKASEFSKLDKTYEATLKLGEISTTGDEEGEKTEISDKNVVEKEVREALNVFIGEIEQTPPVYSAIKVDGKRAYKLARAGKEVKLEPRKVKIYDITDVKYDYPSLSFAAKVSSGTYIRSLAEDIGKKLGTGAYLTELRRTDVGSFSVKDAAMPTETGIDKITQI